MGRKLVKYYTTDPNEWINALGKKDIIIYPDMVEGRIAIKEGDKKPKFAGKHIDSTNYIDSWYKALEYFYNKIK